MSDADRIALARAAGQGDLAAAQRLVALIRRERSSIWTTMPGAYRLRLATPFRAIEIRLDDRDLSPKALAAWEVGPEELAEALLADLTLVHGNLPQGFSIAGFWDNPASRQVSILLEHPSFRSTLEAHEFWRFVPDVELVQDGDGFRRHLSLELPLEAFSP